MAMENESAPAALRSPATAHNARLGLVMFAIYAIVYFGFIVLAAFKYETLKRDMFDGLNLAIVYGMVLIVLAMVMAIIYVSICKRD